MLNDIQKYSATFTKGEASLFNRTYLLQQE